MADTEVPREIVSDESVVDVAARAYGYDPPIDGLIGSGLSQIIAHQRASDILRALGIPLHLKASVLRRWCSGEVMHLGPNELQPPVLPVPPIDDALTHSCDWGWCSDDAVAWRWSSEEAEWLAVCEHHRTSDTSPCPRCEGAGSVSCSLGHELRQECAVCSATGRCRPRPFEDGVVPSGASWEDIYPEPAPSSTSGGGS